MVGEADGSRCENGVVRPLPACMMRVPWKTVGKSLRLSDESNGICVAGSRVFV
jgi:hypothetical protein